MLISAGALIKQSVSLYRENSQLFLRYMIFLFIPTAIITVLGGLLETVIRDANGLLTTIYLVIVAIATVVAFWITLAFIRIVAARCAGKNPAEPAMELRTAISLIWPAIWISILAALIIFGGIILFIIPGIIFSLWFAFSLYALLLDGKKGADALRYSRSLVKGRWWAVLWRLLAPGVFFSIILFVAQGIVAFLFQSLIVTVEQGTVGGAILLVLLSLTTSFFSVLITPLSTAAPTLLYFDLKKNAS